MWERVNFLSAIETKRKKFNILRLRKHSHAIKKITLYLIKVFFFVEIIFFGNALLAKQAGCTKKEILSI